MEPVAGSAKLGNPFSSFRDTLAAPWDGVIGSQERYRRSKRLVPTVNVTPAPL
jgi:hypothetical protein